MVILYQMSWSFSARISKHRFCSARVQEGQPNLLPRKTNLLNEVYILNAKNTE
jgi:hypothetical protein